MTRADVVIIGAGIVGVGCARRLAQRGLRVLVVEREAAPACGSTGRSAAGVRVQFSTRVNIELSAMSIAEYRTMPQAQYRPVGYLFLVDAPNWDAHREGLALQQTMGLPVRELSASEAAARVGAREDGIVGGSFGEIDGFVDPHGITSAWTSEARALGANFRFGLEVGAIAHANGQWRLEAGGESFEAPLLVNAAGAWSGAVAALAGLTVPVEPARRTVFTTAPRASMPGLPADAAGWPLTIDVASGLWLRPEGERLIFGESNPADRGFAEGVDWNWLEVVADHGMQRFPWFESLAIDRRASWWGYYENTPDHQPIVGPMPGAPGWYNACGFSGHGVQQAAAIAQVAAAELLGEPAAIDVASLRIERFDAPARAAERLIV